jgi:hypothetical protein
MDSRLTSEILQIALPSGVVEMLAKRLKVVQRKRKVDLVLLIWILVLGVPPGFR